ncbi:hypothetical protein ACHAW6_013581 [Cyclotella cf. meneghiniana]
MKREIGVEKQDIFVPDILLKPFFTKPELIKIRDTIIFNLLKKTGCSVSIQENHVMVPGSTQRVVTLWASAAVAIAQCRAIIQGMVEKGLQTNAFSTIPPAVGTGSSSIVASKLEKYPKVGRTDSPIEMANAEAESKEDDDLQLQPLHLSIDTANYDIEIHQDHQSYDIFNEVDVFDRFQRKCSSSVDLSADVLSALPPAVDTGFNFIATGQLQNDHAECQIDIPVQVHNYEVEHEEILQLHAHSLRSVSADDDNKEDQPHRPFMIFEKDDNFNNMQGDFIYFDKVFQKDILTCVTDWPGNHSFIELDNEHSFDLAAISNTIKKFGLKFLMPIINSKRNWIKWKVLCEDVIADLDVIKTWIDSMRRNRWFRDNNRDKMLLVFLPKKEDVLTN